MVLADIDLAGAEAVTATLDDAIALRCDVSDHASVEALAAQARAALGGIDLVFANAGTILNGPLIKATPAEFDWLMGVNLRGAWSCLTVFARALLAQDEGGRICVTASEHSLGLQHSGAGLYTASKQAVLALADVLRAELPEKVGISVFCPGIVATGLGDAVRPAHLRQPHERQRAVTKAVQAHGMTSQSVAQLAIAGTVRGDFLIVTHPTRSAPRSSVLPRSKPRSPRKLRGPRSPSASTSTGSSPKCSPARSSADAPRGRRRRLWPAR